MLEPLRKLIASGLPAFGSCAGMIMLADRLANGVAGQQTYGGIDMTVRRNAFGRQVDSFERDIVLTGLSDHEDPLRAVFIRAPWVEQTGPGVAPPDRRAGHSRRGVDHPVAALRRLRHAGAVAQARRLRPARVRILCRDDHARGPADRRSPRPADLRRHRHDRPQERVRPAGRLLRARYRADRASKDEDPLRAVFIRAPWVEQVGTGVSILGTDQGTGRIVAVRQGPLLATAFHPELTPDRRIHQLFVDIVKDNT